MKIKIVTPQEYEEEYVKMIREATHLMCKQARSAERYAKRINNLLYKAARILEENRIR